MDGEKQLKITTENQRQALKVSLKATAQKPLNKRQLARMLCKGEDPVYSRSRDAADFVRKVLSDSAIPMNVKNGKIFRNDISYDGDFS